VNTLDKLIEQYTIANERQNGAEQELRSQSPRRQQSLRIRSSSLDDLTHQAKSGLEW
jgi:hypothetical protein